MDATLPDLLAAVETALGNLLAYLVTHGASPAALHMMQAFSWSIDSLRVALGLRPGVREGSETDLR